LPDSWKCSKSAKSKHVAKELTTGSANLNFRMYFSQGTWDAPGLLDLPTAEILSYSFIKASNASFRQAYGYNDNKIITYEWIMDTKLEIS